MSEGSLKARIQEAMKEAMRAREKERLGTIRLVLAAIKQVEVDERVEPDDTRVIAILDKMVKQRRESIKQYEAANRQELADVEHAEIAIIQDFMPKALDAAEITGIIEKAIADTGASSMKDMGAVMNLARPQLMGKADMGEVSKLVKQRLA